MKHNMKFSNAAFLTLLSSVSAPWASAFVPGVAPRRPVAFAPSAIQEQGSLFRSLVASELWAASTDTIPATGTVTATDTTWTLNFVHTLADIDAGKPQWSEDVPAIQLANDVGVTVTAMPKGANMVELSLGGKNFVWENKEGATYYGEGSDAFPLTRGLILNGGIRFAAVCAEHGLYYDTDWDMTWEGTDDEKSILLSITDTAEQRAKVGDPLNVGQWNREDQAGKEIPGTMTKYPVTNMKFTYKITLKAGEDFVRLSMTVENPTDQGANAEAWLPMTFPIDADSEILSRQVTRWRRDESWNGFLPNVIRWADIGQYGYDFNKPLSWPESGIFYDFPEKQGTYHGCTVDEPGKGVVYYAPETSSHYTKMWGWGDPANFDRQDAIVNDPLAAGRPYSEYYEPWSSGFNFAFFQTTEFKPKMKYNWEVAVLPIPAGLTGDLEAKLTAVEGHIEDRKDKLASIADVTATPME